MIYLTGDTHGKTDLAKLYTNNFELESQLTEKDYMIICGDFGTIFHGGLKDKHRLDFYANKPYTTLWVDGNHENFVEIEKYPVVEWHGGKVQFMRPNVIHLMRGQVYDIDGNKIFTCGGGLSIDKARRYMYLDWWPQEEVSHEEIMEAFRNLEKVNFEVDYVVTHAAPETFVRNELAALKRARNEQMVKMDCSTEKFLNNLYFQIKFKMWYCGHYHMDALLGKEKIYVLFNNIIEIGTNTIMNPGYTKIE